jgi:MerR family transcriptional regulator/heat shock protein HspR
VISVPPSWPAPADAQDLRAQGLLLTPADVGQQPPTSERDIERLRMIQELTQAEGMNLAGVKRIMQMQRDLDRLRDRIRELEAELSRRPIVAPGRRGGTELVPLRSSVVLRWEETPS